MKRLFAIYAVVLMAIVATMSACESGGGGGDYDSNSVAVKLNLEIGGQLSKSFSNDGSHTVNRVLVLPFTKVDSQQPDSDDTNFEPLYGSALQYTLTSFPSGSIILRLPAANTYKVMVIGYNSGDYDFHDNQNANRKFSIGSAGEPTTLANIHLELTNPALSPEFFSCLCDVYDGATLQGNVFGPEDGYTLSGQLQRIASGLYVQLNKIPSYVKSISLVAEKLTITSKATDGSTVTAQTAGDSGNKLLGTQTPTAQNSVAFRKFLLPTFDAGKSLFYLDVENNSNSTVERYTISVADSNVSAGNRLILNPNGAINITGRFSDTGLDFTLGMTINLDDNNWDGYQ